ncbi:MAG: PH domain-containing protein [Anaerotruncus sp.]|nr:PH domain-containing protein [Anaerotruncus sp.]
MEKLEPIQYLWKDRKRILGLPLSFTRYSLSEDRLFLETGLLNLHTEEIILYRVRDLSLKMRFWQRVFGVGSVIVQSSDKTTPILELESIKQPREVKEMIYRQVEAMKEARRMRLGEMLDDHDCSHAEQDEQEE